MKCLPVPWLYPRKQDFFAVAVESEQVNEMLEQFIRSQILKKKQKLFIYLFLFVLLIDIWF